MECIALKMFKTSVVAFVTFFPVFIKESGSFKHFNI